MNGEENGLVITFLFSFEMGFEWANFIYDAIQHLYGWQKFNYISWNQMTYKIR